MSWENFLQEIANQRLTKPQHIETFIEVFGNKESEKPPKTVEGVSQRDL